jgi:hypothetical protein
VYDLTLNGEYITFYFVWDEFSFETKSDLVGDLNWIFDRFGYVVKVENPLPDMNYFFTYNLGEIYDEMQTKYVEEKGKGEIDNKA